MYPNMQTRTLLVNGREVLTDSEGYIVNLDDWSEGFVRAQAAAEGLELTDEHWEVVNFLREYFAEHGVQCEVRKMVKHFRQARGSERGNSRYLHRILPPRRTTETGQSPGRAVADQKGTLTPARFRLSAAFPVFNDWFTKRDLLSTAWRARSGLLPDAAEADCVSSRLFKVSVHQVVIYGQEFRIKKAG